MFNFFKRKGGKAEAAAGTADKTREYPNFTPTMHTPVASRAPRQQNDVTNEKPTIRKDVVNLLIPETNYAHKSGGVGALLQIMAGKRKRNNRKTTRAESCRVSPPKEMNVVNLQRSKSDLQPSRVQDTSACDVDAPTTDKNTRDAPQADADPADFVKALVLQKYANKSPVDTKQHVSLVYVSNEPDLEEKRHAEALLREIARSIDCTIDEINAKKAQMGTTESKQSGNYKRDPVYETIDERDGSNSSIDSFKTELKDELQRQEESENNIDTLNDSIESPDFPKKSNLKVPKSDTEGCSDDDRSDGGKKRVTFRKHIIFDDGEQQTDEEMDSSFASLTSEEEESDDDEYLEDSPPDNDELLGGVTVSRTESDNKTVINVNSDENEPLKLTIEVDDEFKRISSDNSDSGFLDIGDRNGSGDDVSEVKSVVEVSEESEVSESEEEEEIEEEVEEEEEEIEEEELTEEIEETVVRIVEPGDANHFDNMKTLVSQDNKFNSQVSALTELAESRCDEAEQARDIIAAYRKEIEERDHEIERLKTELAAAYKESELVRQRSRSLEEELSAARTCSANLADQLQRRNEESVRQLQSELDDSLTRRAELESQVLALERDKDRLQQEKVLQEQKAQEALGAAEANTARWRAAHETARSQAAARAERMLHDCEWKMRELEKRARDAEHSNKQLTATVDELKNVPVTPAQSAELTQLRGVLCEQQRAVQGLTLQLQQVETREEALKLEVHRLKELLDRETRNKKEKEERYSQTIQRLEQQQAKAIETLKSEHTASAAAARTNYERANADRTRNALSQLRAEADREAKNADRRLREVTQKYEALKEELANKEAEFEHAIVEAHSKADWDIMQLRHMLDKSDITYANNVEQITGKFEKEQERLIAEWSEKLRVAEEDAATAEDEAKTLLESTKSRLIAEKNELINKLKEDHRIEMDEQWEQFMTDKESCLNRMKVECQQEGEEDRVKREKELLEEIAELRAQVSSKSTDFDHLVVEASRTARTLAVADQELREALARERELRERRAEDAVKLKKAENSSKDQVDHLNRKCACLRKLFDDMRTRMAAREGNAAQEAKSREKELHQLRAEVSRLTKILVSQDSRSLGARTCADGCETGRRGSDLTYFSEAAPPEPEPDAPRRKGGTLKTPEAIRKRLQLPELKPLPKEAKLNASDIQYGRRRSKSVDLPAVQVPVRIRQLEEKNK